MFLAPWKPKKQYWLCFLALGAEIKGLHLAKTLVFIYTVFSMLQEVYSFTMQKLHKHCKLQCFGHRRAPKKNSKNRPKSVQNAPSIRKPRFYLCWADFLPLQNVKVAGPCPAQPSQGRFLSPLEKDCSTARSSTALCQAQPSLSNVAFWTC